MVNLACSLRLSAEDLVGLAEADIQVSDNMISRKSIDPDMAAFLVASREVDKGRYAGHTQETDSYGTSVWNEVLIRNNPKSERLPNKRPPIRCAMPQTTISPAPQGLLIRERHRDARLGTTATIHRCIRRWCERVKQATDSHRGAIFPRNIPRTD
jgi:hypothetical protein